MSHNPLARFKRLTVKIGSALLVDTDTGRLRDGWLSSLADDLAALKAAGTEIVVVSSGAISLGRRVLGLTGRKLALDESQAAASVGQIALSQAWRDAFNAYGVTTGQILITPNITEDRRHYLNARTTIATLLRLGAVPIINENDSVATAEIRYGDNDRLSARVAVMVEADGLLILSDVDGLYTAPPLTDPRARHIPVVQEITPDIEAMAGGAASQFSRGGMQTKIEAGKIATGAGTALIIARGTRDNPVRALAEGGRHTLFEPALNPAAARKRWILGTLEVAGTITVDDGAASALKSGKSLLPIGVTHISGDFSRGDTLSIVTADGREIARGLAGMNGEDAQAAKGKKSAAIQAMFGELNRTELIHADNIVLVGHAGNGGTR